MRKKNCLIMGRTIVTAFYKTRVPWLVGVMLIDKAAIGLRSAWIAPECVSRVENAAVPLVALYMETAPPMSVSRLDTMYPDWIVGQCTSL
jgi:hypothetical protein